MLAVGHVERDIDGCVELAHVDRLGDVLEETCGQALRAIARHGYPVFFGGTPSGTVCSGTMSPSLSVAIGTCYLPAAGAKEGTRFEIDVRGSRVTATVLKPPFYKNATHR